MADNSPCESASYEFVVVGGGTAGCVVVTRFSELPNFKILVLEASGNHNDGSRVKTPALFSQMISDPELDWKYHTVPQFELNVKTICQPRGKGLGGSSMINALAIVLPSKVGFDTWSEMGNPG